MFLKLEIIGKQMRPTAIRVFIQVWPPLQVTILCPVEFCISEEVEVEVIGECIYYVSAENISTLGFLRLES